jgi:hypothetical protein
MLRARQDEGQRVLERGELFSEMSGEDESIDENTVRYVQEEENHKRRVYGWR